MKRAEAISVRRRFLQLHTIQWLILFEAGSFLEFHLLNATYGDRDEKKWQEVKNECEVGCTIQASIFLKDS